GHWAAPAMAGLCGFAYLYGAVIRYNIAEVEPALKAEPTPALRSLERASDLALGFAYFISVAYYINLFAAFALKSGDMVNPMWTRLISTGVIGALGLIGFLRGLRSIENVEIFAVSYKLSIIAGLIAGLIFFMMSAASTGTLQFAPMDHATGLEEMRVLLGLVILVQGFETSRFLGEAYDAKTRIETMRWAQLVSTGIYIVFILAMTPHFTGDIPEQGGETAIIDMLRPLGVLIAPAIITMAIASQISAAVADMNGASGIISENTPERVTMKWGYAVTALAAISVTWSGDIFEIIVYASKAFVIYYGLECVTASYMAVKTGHSRWRILGLSTIGALTALAVLFLGVPAEGG
ncbi:MAG: hypothetical protein KDA46_15095, partial [Parvularculaceae bacterium]|nr:hypothetical protein [Parvularculaceae bacterium]